MLVVLAAAAALAGSDRPADGPPAAVDAKPVCRSDTPTGSHFTKRICHTRADWKLIDAHNEQMGRALNNGGRGGMQSEGFAKQQY